MSQAGGPQTGTRSIRAPDKAQRKHAAPETPTEPGNLLLPQHFSPTAEQDRVSRVRRVPARGVGRPSPVGHRAPGQWAACRMENGDLQGIHLLSQQTNKGTESWVPHFGQWSYKYAKGEHLSQPGGSGLELGGPRVDTVFHGLMCKCARAYLLTYTPSHPSATERT